MMKTYFFDFLTANLSVDTPTLEMIQDKISMVALPKGAVLLTEGQISDQVFFICKGMARAFYQEEGMEMTSWFAAENNFIYSVSSYAPQKPSYESIQLLEPSTLIVIKKTDFDQMAKKSLNVANVAIRILEHYIFLHDQRARLLRLPANERYYRFMRANPYAQRANVGYIASYLGLSRSTINLIRAKK